MNRRQIIQQASEAVLRYQAAQWEEGSYQGETASDLVDRLMPNASLKARTRTLRKAIRLAQEHEDWGVTETASEKTCPECEQTKPAGEFWRNQQQRDGLSTYCIACKKAQRRVA